MTPSTLTLVPVVRARDLPPFAALTATVRGRRIALFHAGDGFHATAADCPHAGGPLADGLLGDGCVTCPLHGRRFDLRTGDGAGAAEGEPGLAVYPVVEREGWLLVGVDGAGAGAP